MGLFQEGLGREGIAESDCPGKLGRGHPGYQAQAESLWPPGVQRQSVYCMEQQAGLVDEEHCDPLNRPDDHQRKCSKEPCPAR